MKCGWCKAKGLQPAISNGDGKGLETHYKPNTRTQCDGPATSEYFGANKRKR